ncbi:sensor histidine kinase [Patiriisocius marinus]|uniref:sensor histidine kinase n=1 Tax=Patiriisocius marinus TaxID=1397112 RepID=UPI00232E3762|nr:HAMP domain-containing sensor histidine kinase [Patiriisocius marinus]
MKNKITILIFLSVIVLIALSSIQAYLIQNTYELKKKAFIQETDDLVSKISSDERLDSIYDVWSDQLKDHISDFKNKRITESDLIGRMKDNAETLNKQYDTIFQTELKKLDIGYDVQFKKNLAFLVITQDEVRDSIFPLKDRKRMMLFGEDFNEEEATIINTQRTFTKNEFFSQEEGEIVTLSFDLEIYSVELLLIKDWKRIVYGQMTLLLLGSVLLFLFVIGLLYYSIKNLVTQKRIAEIKTDFINNITHELKTPLATLSIATKSLRSDVIKNNESAFNNTLNIVNRQNERLQKLIDQVMNNSLSNEEILLNREQVIDNTYFINVLEDFKLSTQHGDLKVINNIYEPEVLLRIDKFQFTTAITNILENAVKYGVEKTVITVSSSIVNGEYLIEIRDNGVGISERNQKLIFEKFYRVSEGNVHDVKGLGLGLYYTYQIIKAHNGSIKIESELNKGTTFIIKIPVK